MSRQHEDEAREAAELRPKFDGFHGFPSFGCFFPRGVCSASPDNAWQEHGWEEHPDHSASRMHHAWQEQSWAAAAAAAAAATPLLFWLKRFVSTRVAAWHSSPPRRQGVGFPAASRQLGHRYW